MQIASSARAVPNSTRIIILDFPAEVNWQIAENLIYITHSLDFSPLCSFSLDFSRFISFFQILFFI